MKTPFGFVQKYYKWLPLLGVLPVVDLALPYLKMDGNTYLGIQMLVMGARSVKETSFFSVLFGGTGALIMALLVTASMTAFLLRPSKKLCYLPIVMETLYLFFQCASLLQIKKQIDAAGYFAEKFMIRNLGIGYWLMFFIGFAGLWIVMAADKISPGYIILVVLSVIWLFPIFYITMNAFRQEGSFYVNYVIPKSIGFKNFMAILFDDSKFHYIRWFKNTLLVAVCSCALSSFIVLSTAYTLSRVRFAGRKIIMNLLLILGMFPAFMSMIAVYYILKGMGLAQSLAALVLVYSGGASLSYYVAKGFFDTIPKALDEAAYMDGATKWTVFTRITIPLSKPIIIYTILTSFMAPWADYIFASVILGDKSDHYTIAMGLFNMLSKENIDKYFTQFAAGAVLISVPIAALFISLQKYYVEGLSGSVKG